MAEVKHTALVTGGTRRIGAAIAHDLAAGGFRVAVHHHGSGRDAETLVADFNANGREAFAVEADLTGADFKRRTDALILKNGPSLDEFGATIRWLWNTPSVTGQMIALDGGQHLGWRTPDVVGARE